MAKRFLLLFATAVLTVNGCSHSGALGKKPVPQSEATPDPFVGKKIVVGLTYVDPKGKPAGSIETSGQIVRLNQEEGFVIDRPDGKGLFSLPPDRSRIRKATQHTYRFNSTGEVVVGPAYECTLTITVPVTVAQQMRSGQKSLQPEYMKDWSDRPPKP